MRGRVRLEAPLSLKEGSFMTHIVFKLSMPSNNAWNGKWTGEGKLYAIVRNIQDRNRAKIAPLLDRRFTYNFGDGWVAAIDVYQTPAFDAKRVMKESKGFQGYEWMVDSLIGCGKIDADWPTVAPDEVSAHA
jgi:hypothetical protein